MMKIRRVIIFGVLNFLLISGWLKLEAEAGAIRFPYEQVIFELGPKGFHPNLKYPPYRQCMKPIKVLKRVGPINTEDISWRVFWSQSGWNSYYLDDEDATFAWESQRESPVPVNMIVEHGLPIGFVLGWITAITAINMFLYPILSMIFVLIMLGVWSIMSNRWIRSNFRYLLVRYQRAHRDYILRLYEDAGRRPPFYRYSLPRFLRENPQDAVQKELDETDNEFWSSDEENDEDKALESDERLRKLQATPEFTPEYPVDPDNELIVSDELFSYLLRVSHHGMFAVWTDGLADLNLQEISDSSRKKITFAVHNADLKPQSTESVNNI